MRISKKDEVTDILKLIAPGTLIREGLDNILKAKTGALLVFSDNKEVLDLVDGGFFIDEEYTPSKLYELAKMDGAIILSTDLKRILYANAQLIPSPEIETTEDKVCKQEEKLKLFKDMQKLDELSREILYLRMVGNLNFIEIGEILGKTPNWARVNFYRAKQKMKEVNENGKKKRM